MSIWQIGLLIVVGIWILTRGIPNLIEAYAKEQEARKEDKRTEELWKRLEALGYSTGKARMPPEFPTEFKLPSDLGILDTMNEVAFMNGWSRGYEEVSKSDKSPPQRAAGTPQPIPSILKWILGILCLLAAVVSIVANIVPKATPQAEASANSTPPQWISDTKTGCKVWNPQPKPNESVSWSGACVNGFGSGHGIERWAQNGNAGNILEGALLNGQPSGDFFVQYPNGDTYVGELLDGVREGIGTYTHADGRQDIGHFTVGRYSGP